MAVLEDLVDRTRLELGDLPQLFTTRLTGDGVTKSFYVDAKPLDATLLSVSVDGVAAVKPDDYTVEEALGVIHFVTAPAAGDEILVEGTHFRYFSPTDLVNFINTAVLQHTTGKTDAYGTAMTLGKIPPVEEYPVVLLALIEALWALATDAAFDINITAPDGVNIPRSQRFQQLSNIIAQRQAQYRELCAALNLGPWRVEIGVLRRVSRTTNKLVPVYVPQEIDDSRRPERVYLPTTVYGHSPLPTTASAYDIAFTQGDSWTATFDFPFDLTPYTLKAELRTYPNSPSKYGQFDIAIDPDDNTKAILSLPADKTKYLPVRLFWDLQMTNEDDPDWQQTYIKGQVFVDRQVTE